MSELSRREFFSQSALYGGSLWLLLNMPRPRALHAAQESTRPEVLGEAQWKTVEAVTGRIIPTDHEPGAIEANCVNFIDKALAHEDAAMKPLYRSGVAALESGKAEGWPSGAVTAAEFFATVRVHTIVGFLADPKYGGNRGYAGWKVLGYPGGGHHMGGYSPAQMMGEEKIKTVWGEEV